jgi:hypothetical protein
MAAGVQLLCGRQRSRVLREDFMSGRRDENRLLVLS